MKSFTYWLIRQLNTGTSYDNHMNLWENLKKMAKLRFGMNRQKFNRRSAYIKFLYFFIMMIFQTEMALETFSVNGLQELFDSA